MKYFINRYAIPYLLFTLLFSLVVVSVSSAEILDPANVVEKDYGKYSYVWFETNAQSYLDSYIEHAPSWENIGRPMATARIHNVEPFLSQLGDANLSGVSGIKTSNAFENRDFHDPQAWQEIAATARRISTLTGGKPVILENEGAVKKLLDSGVTAVDYDALVKVISEQQWPEIWFWYAPSGRRGPVISISYDVARAVMNGIDNARLIEPHSCGYASSPTNSHSKAMLELTLSLDPNPISIIYLDNERRNFWKLIDTNVAIEHAAGDTVIIYPLLSNLEKSAEVLDSLDHK